MNNDVVRSDIDNQAFSKVAFPKILIKEKLKTMIQFFEKNLYVFFFTIMGIFFFFTGWYLSKLYSWTHLVPLSVNIKKPNSSDFSNGLLTFLSCMISGQWPLECVLLQV